VADPIELDAAAAAALIDADAELIDVRRPHEYEAGHIPGARHIELNLLQDEAVRLGADTPIVVYCRTGERSAMAAEALRDGGFEAHSMTGGIETWSEDGRALEPVDGYVAESGRAAAILEVEGRFPVERVDPPEE
jgi:rhodanese-related sulfurtransferase